MGGEEASAVRMRRCYASTLVGAIWLVLLSLTCGPRRGTALGAGERGLAVEGLTATILFPTERTSVLVPVTDMCARASSGTQMVVPNWRCEALVVCGCPSPLTRVRQHTAFVTLRKQS